MTKYGVGKFSNMIYRMDESIQSGRSTETYENIGADNPAPQ